MAIFLVQCLCGPQRHCLIAVAGEGDTPASLITTLKGQVEIMLEAKLINPHCALCGATSDTWLYEAGRTRFTSLDEAEPVLRAEERKQRQMAEALKALGLAYDRPAGTQN